MLRLRVWVRLEPVLRLLVWERRELPLLRPVLRLLVWERRELVLRLLA